MSEIFNSQRLSTVLDIHTSLLKLSQNN